MLFHGFMLLSGKQQILMVLFLLSIVNPDLQQAYH